MAKYPSYVRRHIATVHPAGDSHRVIGVAVSLQGVAVSSLASKVVGQKLRRSSPQARVR